jgi:hypothetical protein
MTTKAKLDCSNLELVLIKHDYENRDNFKTEWPLVTIDRFDRNKFSGCADTTITLSFPSKGAMSFFISSVVSKDTDYIGMVEKICEDEFFVNLYRMDWYTQGHSFTYPMEYQATFHCTPVSAIENYHIITKAISETKKRHKMLATKQIIPAPLDSYNVMLDAFKYYLAMYINRPDMQTFDNSHSKGKDVQTMIFGECAACNPSLPTIKQVYLNDPFLTVLWSDGEKTVVKCYEKDEFDPEIGLAMAISKQYFKDLGKKHPRDAFKFVLSKSRVQTKKKPKKGKDTKERKDNDN